MALKLSIGQDNVNFQEVIVDSINDIVDLKRNNSISPGIYDNNHRSRKNFREAHTIAFDVDGTLPIVDCRERLKDYSYVLITSKSHKPGTDRYHVFLPLQEPITDARAYERAIQSLLKIIPEADEKCKDASRQFFASPQDAHFEKHQGRSYSISNVTELPIQEGSRNDILFKMAVKARNAGVDYETILTALIRKNRTCSPPLELGEIETIAQSATNYEDKSGDDDLGLMTLGELYKNKEEIQWAVDGLLTEGGISILAAQPKVGKSTLIRQLTKCIIMGELFLGRKVKQGPVINLALEEQDVILRDQYRRLGLNESSPLYIRTRAIHDNPIDYLDIAILKIQPRLVVIDTMNLLTKISNLNDYAEVTRVLAPFRDLARRTNTHIMFIYHSNKNYNAVGTDSVMGSTGIRGAVDCTIVLSKTGTSHRRRLDSEQRGGTPFDEQDIDFTPSTQTYAILRKTTASAARGFGDSEEGF